MSLPRRDGPIMLCLADRFHVYIHGVTDENGTEGAG
jgi:hypothetical protein